ncbi:MAG TPA: cobalamin-binding protein [Casimicrobiaceae bacterium]|nr:cobalamin-binding protein [Casimicrobiaceae bacterium]
MVRRRALGDVTRGARAAFAATALAGALAFGPAQADVVAVDDAGATIRLAQPARRIVSLAPHATELLFAAGAGARVVGVVAGSNFPPAAAGIPVVGDANAIDLERLVALAPDLVVTWPYTTSAQLDAIRRRGIAVFTSDARSIDGVGVDLERIGTLAGTPGAAARAARAFRAAIEAARPRPGASREPTRVFYEIWGAPIFTIGGHHLISEAIALCGGVNVFADLGVAAPVVDEEAVIAAAPQVIVAGADDARRPPWLDAWRRWPQIPAVRDGRLRVVDANLLHRAGPRFAQGVAALCAAIRD